MTPTITIQTRDAALIATLQAATPPAGAHLQQEQPVPSGVGALMEFTLHHGPALDGGRAMTWVRPLLHGHDYLVLSTHPPR